MHQRFGLAVMVMTLALAGCSERMGGYIAAASISQNGFARDGEEMREAEAQDIRLWGFVAPRNLYGNAGARRILADWWSGEGPSPMTWRFNLKARDDDEAGRSFPVHVPNDQGCDALLKVFVANARAGRPTKVFLKGRLFTFDAPTNTGHLTGLYLELQSSQDILLGRPAGNRGTTR